MNKDKIFLLDFDGVLFDTAKEVYKICELLANNIDDYELNLSYESFLIFRKQLTNAWQINRILNKNYRDYDFSSKLDLIPNKSDLEFQDIFFEYRKKYRRNNKWINEISPHLFFRDLLPYIERNPRQFKVISTRDALSIKEMLRLYLKKDIEVCGQEYIRKYGNKRNAAKVLNWLSRDSTIFIDDMIEHIKLMENHTFMSILANWGYGEELEISKTEKYCLKIIKENIVLK